MISFGRQTCSDFQNASRKEWLETNGLGGYALSSLCLASTRKHHGLLVIAQDPPGKKFVLLNRLEEKVSYPGCNHYISCQEYQDTIAPRGYKFFEQFSLNPFPTFTYLVEDARIRKTFFLVSGENTAVIIYELLSGSPVQMEVRPLVSMRPVDTVSHQDERFVNTLECSENGMSLSPNGLPCLTVKTTDGFFQRNPCWYYNLVYSQDFTDEREDLFSPGIFRFSLWPGKKAAIVASADHRDTVSIDKLYHKELFIRTKIPANFPIKGDFAHMLLQAGDQFVVSGPRATSIVQGYPWYEESVRDSLIALPGLCLVNGRFPEAKEILLKNVELLKDSSSPVDTVLWFFWAVQKYFEHSGDIEFVRSIHHHLMSMYMHIRKGRAGYFNMDEDGLVCFEESPSPFYGKSSDIQALWYNALQFMEEVEIRIGGKRKRYKDLALRVRESFNMKFWNEKKSYLYHSITKDWHDDAIRPEALLAISLPYPVLDQKRFNDVFITVWKKLYTSFGLRSVAPEHPQYKGVGDETDRSYGRIVSPGCVSPFWMGAFVTAYCRVFGHNVQSRSQAWQFLFPFAEHLSESLVGSISEMFDGNRPHYPRGCPSYALGVAELLRVLVEEIGCQPEEHRDLSIAEIMASKGPAKKLGDH